MQYSTRKKRNVYFTQDSNGLSVFSKSPCILLCQKRFYRQQRRRIYERVNHVTCSNHIISSTEKKPIRHINCDEKFSRITSKILDSPARNTPSILSANTCSTNLKFTCVYIIVKLFIFHLSKTLTVRCDFSVYAAIVSSEKKQLKYQINNNQFNWFEKKKKKNN